MREDIKEVYRYALRRVGKRECDPGGCLTEWVCKTEVLNTRQVKRDVFEGFSNIFVLNGNIYEELIG